MNQEQRQVLDFHKAFDGLVSPAPVIPDAKTQKLRVDLIQEELDELREAFEKNDVTGVADALTDILYVTYGAGISCGIDLQPVFQEVHRSNMSKVGGHKREDGKWVKPPTYSPAQIEPILKNQAADAMRK